jgi:hypothetical protein
VTEVIRTTVGTVSAIAKVVAVAEGAEDGDAARVVPAFTTTLLVIASSAVVARNVPVRARPSGCFSEYQIWRQNCGDHSRQQYSFHCSFQSKTKKKNLDLQKWRVIFFWIMNSSQIPFQLIYVLFEDV